MTDFKDNSPNHQNGYDDEVDGDYRDTEQRLTPGGVAGAGDNRPQKRQGYDNVEMSYGINSDEDRSRADDLEYVDENTQDSGEESLIPGKKVSSSFIHS